jgi:hypothetical protein
VLQELSYVDPGIIEHSDQAHDNAIIINRRSETLPANINETTLASTVYQTDPLLANNILQVMRPNTARIMGDRIDFGALDTTTADTLRIHAHGLGLAYTDIDLSAAIPTDDTDTIVRTINSDLHAGTSHYPCSAYNVDGRLVIAHNIPGWENTIEVLSTPANSAHTALGFSDYADSEYDWADGYCSAYVGGERLEDLKPLITIRYDHTTAVDLNLISPELEDLQAYGLTLGNEGLYLCNITNHDTDSENGTYYIIGYSGDSAFYLNADIAQGEFDLEVVADSVSFEDNAQGQIYDIFAEYDADGYGIITKSLKASYNTHSNVDIKSLSPDFPTSVVNWRVEDAEYVTFIDATESGTAVYAPSGYTGELKVYAPDNINSALVQVTGTPAGTATHSMTVSAFAGTDDRLYLSSAHYSGNFGSTLVRYPIDKRKIGGTVENQYQDRLVRVPLDEALGELRNNGVIRGFDVISNTGTTIRVRGGRALIEGKLVDVETKNVTIDSFTSAKRLLLLDENGHYRAVNIDAGGYNESEFIVSDSYGDLRNVAVICDFGTTATALDNTFTDRRLMVNKIDKRLYDVERGLNQRIDNLFSSVGGSMWAFSLARSTDAYGEYLGEIDLAGNAGMAEVDEVGFVGGDALITTRRWEIINSDAYGLSLFQSPGQTHLNLMLQLNYGANGPLAFGTSGEVNIYCGLDCVTGMTIRPHESSSRLVHSEQYVRVRTIDTTVFPISDVAESYVISIPTSNFSNLVNNICFDALPRIRISGCDQIDGGVNGDPAPLIQVGLVRIIGSSYSIAGTLLESDGSATALAASVGEIL